MQDMPKTMRIDEHRGRALTRLVASLQHVGRQRWGIALGTVLVLALLALGTYLTFVTGGTQHVYLHIMYLPVILAAFLFRTPGGLLAGLLAGLALGPWMPRDVSAGAMQPSVAWLYRSGFFALIGGVTGALATLLNARYGTLADTYAHTLKSFASLVEQRDEQTGAHCERVAHNACMLGKALSLDPLSLETLYWGGILHDLGKVATPAWILLKPGKLTEEEYEEIKKHTEVGAGLLTAISPHFARIAAGLRSHHERWDGGGYPDGLAGIDIPLFGRILAVVDVFEALTSERPYRQPLPSEEALAYLEQECGGHFDPDLVTLFVSLYHEGKISVASDSWQPREIEFEPPLPINEVAA